MISIDWSKAPEDATHGGVGRIPFWVKGLTESGFMFMNKGDICWREAQGAPNYPLSPRPAGWTGEGLPPEGTNCELKFGHWNDWEQCTVLYVGEKMVFVRQVTRSGETFEGAMNREGVMFRPIRTAEQIAAEERTKACDKMFGVILSLPEESRRNVSDICEALYDAGYRK